MALDKVLTDHYALYLGDAIEVMSQIRSQSIHLSIYSPPFAAPGGGALYHYTSSERDLSNARTYEEFFVHYGYVVRELARLTLPGRMSCVHCMDVPTGNSGCDALMDFPGDIIRLHREHGWSYVARYHVWKEPLTVRNRTLKKGLAHRTIVEDSSKCSVASADYLLVFRNRGENPIPIPHPQGLMEYAGSRPIPVDVLPYRNWRGKQTENRYSHWIWRQYASSFWDDVRLDNVLPFRDARDDDDERHIHALQLDVIDRILVLWSNPGEVVLSPFAGVGSEIYGAVKAGRRGVGVELKRSYYVQAVRNLQRLDAGEAEQPMLFAPEQAEPESMEALLFDEVSV